MLHVFPLNLTIYLGNTVYQKTYDWIGMPYLDAPATGFGPDHCESRRLTATSASPELGFSFP